MALGTIKVGRLTLAEAIRPAAEAIHAQTRARTVRLSGQESTPPLTAAELEQRHADLVALGGGVTPVVFTDKAGRSGYYRVADTGSAIAVVGSVLVADWELALEPLGGEHETDLESRLSGPQSRQNDHAVVGERIHCPPAGHYAYSAGTTLPTTMTRTGSGGALTVYRGIPVGVHPRWACPPSAYLGGRVLFTDVDGFERSGVDVSVSPAFWQLDNGLVRVTPSGGLLDVAAWSGGAWRSKLWDLRVSGSPLGAPSSLTLLRNEPEMVVARLTWAHTPGRTTADLTLRRGFRFVEVWIETQTSATIRVQRSTAEAATAVTGGLRATANDGDGNRYWAASLRTASTDLTGGALFKASTTTLGLAIGAEVGGSAAVSGDLAADLIKQYAGAASERVEGVRR